MNNCPHCRGAVMPEPIAGGRIACDNCGGEWTPKDPTLHGRLVEAWNDYDREFRKEHGLRDQDKRRARNKRRRARRTP